MADLSVFIAKAAHERKIISDIKRSASSIGKLYPVLVDEQGQVIDGAHRLKADPNWFKVKVPGVKSEEDRLLARLITNVCRRNVSPGEKTLMLDELGQVYLEQGVPHSELVKTIALKTGMSYRWVMKYASKDLKVRPGIGGPKIQGENWDTQVAYRATGEDRLLAEPAQRVANLACYSNTNFATILIEKRFYLKLENGASELGVDIDTIINNVLLQTLQRVNRLIEQHKVPAVICTTK